MRYKRLNAAKKQRNLLEKEMVDQVLDWQKNLPSVQKMEKKINKLSYEIKKRYNQMNDHLYQQPIHRAVMPQLMVNEGGDYAIGPKHQSVGPARDTFVPSPRAIYTDQYIKIKKKMPKTEEGI